MSDPLAAAAPLPTASTPAMIAERLREAIVAGRFAPGEQLAEAALAARLGVSRGPIREAIARLVQEGLLTAIRNRGVFVVTLGPADIADVYEARRAVERHATAALLRRRDPDRLVALADVVDRMVAAADAADAGSVAALDLAFHEAVVAGAGSPRLSRMFATLAAETRICLTGVAGAYRDLHDVATEHRVLLDLLRAGGRRQVLAALDEHLDSGVRSLTG